MIAYGSVAFTASMHVPVLRSARRFRLIVWETCRIIPHWHSSYHSFPLFGRIDNTIKLHITINAGGWLSFNTVSTPISEGVQRFKDFSIGSNSSIILEDRFWRAGTHTTSTCCGNYRYRGCISWCPHPASFLALVERGIAGILLAKGNEIMSHLTLIGITCNDNHF